MMQSGNLAVTEDYELYLEWVLESHERDNPSGHIRRS